METLGARLRSERKKLGLTQQQMADMCMVQNTTQSNYETGLRTPDSNYLKIALDLGVDIHFLLTGIETTPKNTNTSSKNEIHVPYFSLVEVSAGTGLYPLDETVNESVSISKDIFLNELKYMPKNLSVIKVKGDSMIGVLNDGDRIVIDHDRNEIQEGIFVIRIDGELLVKRIQRMTGRIINIISSNPDYLPIPISLDNPPDDFAIIGKVILVCKFI